MFQYRTALEPPENTTGVLGNGTKIPLTDLNFHVRSPLAKKTFEVVDQSGNKGQAIYFSTNGFLREFN
jgi:hypothetical protein